MQPLMQVPGAVESDATAPPSHRLYPLAMGLAYLVPAAMLGLVGWCVAHGEPMNISGEDGLVEWATVVAFALCSLVAIVALVVHRSCLTRAQRILLTVFALGCLVAVGEEISWGQRIFGFSPPESLASGSGGVVEMGHNDVTWHNLSLELGFMRFSLGGFLFSLPLFVALFVHGIWLPMRVRAGKDREQRLSQKLGLFLPPLHLGILLLGLVLLLHFGKPLPNTETREYKELACPVMYVFILLHAFFRTRRPAHLVITASAVSLLLVGLWASFALAV